MLSRIKNALALRIQPLITTKAAANTSQDALLQKKEDQQNPKKPKLKLVTKSKNGDSSAPTPESDPTELRESLKGGDQAVKAKAGNSAYQTNSTKNTDSKKKKRGNILDHEAE